MATMDQVLQAQDVVLNRYGDQAGVNGIGIAKASGKRDDYAVKVNVEDGVDLDIPSEVSGVPVIVEVVGRVSKRGKMRRR